MVCAIGYTSRTMLNIKMRKIGGSQYIAIPPQVLKAIGVPEGAELSLRFDSDRIVLERPDSRPSREVFLRMLDEVMTEDAAILRELAR